jgi:hypothetical protein
MMWGAWVGIPPGEHRFNFDRQAQGDGRTPDASKLGTTTQR